MNEAIIAGADIGGSHITAAIIDAATRKIIGHTMRRREIDSGKDAEDIFNAWSAVIKESMRTVNSKSCKIGIAMPGPFDYVNGICYISDQNKYDALYGLNVKDRLAEKLKISTDDILIVNDAVCFLQGEVFGGAGKGYDRILGLTLGTGLGTARLLDGETEDGNLWCAEYKEGIAEDYLSTRWFLKRYKEVSGQEVKGVKELVGRYQDDALVQQVFNEFGIHLANFLIPYIKAEQLQLVVLGGNISLAYTHFSKAVRRTLDHAHVEVDIKTSELRENAALIGAASNHCVTLNI